MEKIMVFYFCLECCKDSKNVFVFVLARTVDNYYSFKDENITLYRRGNESSENVMKVRVLSPFGSVFWGLQLR